MYKNCVNLGKKLKELRGNISVESASKDTGVPLDYLLRLEDGTKESNPSTHALYKLADYYKCELKELLVLAGIIIPNQKYDTCCNCGESFIKKNGVACCSGCEARIGDAFN